MTQPPRQLTLESGDRILKLVRGNGGPFYETSSTNTIKAVMGVAYQCLRDQSSGICACGACEARPMHPKRT